MKKKVIPLCLYIYIRNYKMNYLRHIFNIAHRNTFYQNNSTGKFTQMVPTSVKNKESKRQIKIFCFACVD